MNTNAGALTTPVKMRSGGTAVLRTPLGLARDGEAAKVMLGPHSLSHHSLWWGEARRRRRRRPSPEAKKISGFLLFSFKFTRFCPLRTVRIIYQPASCSCVLVRLLSSTATVCAACCAAEAAGRLRFGEAI